MAEAKPKAQLAESFEKLLGELTTAAELQADATCKAEQRNWFAPPDWVGNPVMDIVDELHKSFDRSKLEDMWAQATTDGDNPGTTTDLIAITIQTDCLATAERAYRCRHLTRIRAFAHSAARRYAHGSQHGLFKGVQQTYVKNILKAGGS